MILIFLGGIGSGKSLSIVKEIINSKNFAYTNFKLKHIKNYQRIRFEDVVTMDERNKLTVNWPFWEEAVKKGNFSIYLDEIHNIMSSRRSMSSVNVQISRFISQIRKVLSDHPNNHLIVISQTMRKIDCDLRDLAQLIVECSSFKSGDKIFIRQKWYDGIDRWVENRHSFTIQFLANPFFRYYDTREMIKFSESEEYL